MINSNGAEPRTFQEDLQYSLAASGEEFWEAVYRKAFSNLWYTELCTNMKQQKQGIDRVLYLKNNNVLTVDEKKSRRVYESFALEHTSNVERGTPGWMEKDLAIDYLAYAFMPIKVCYLFPWPMLRRAWLQYGKEWREKYWDELPGYTKLANGESYTTHCVGVPIEVVRQAVSSVAIIDVASEVDEQRLE